MNTRRDFLKSSSFGGAILFAPFLKSVAAHATGTEAAFPKLFVFIVKASGMESGEHFGQLDPALKELDLKGPLQELLA
jgi:hypothetical protein